MVESKPSKPCTRTAMWCSPVVCPCTPREPPTPARPPSQPPACTPLRHQPGPSFSSRGGGPDLLGHTPPRAPCHPSPPPGPRRGGSKARGSSPLTGARGCGHDDPPPFRSSSSPPASVPAKTRGCLCGRRPLGEALDGSPPCRSPCSNEGCMVEAAPAPPRVSAVDETPEESPPLRMDRSAPPASLRSDSH